ncbi:hypothetical protein [Fibrobacter succinogenes]|uniref:Outer membrane protein beta-barrel domain-containing protein n=1 Tax=Fibrobacter succinogenes TaxID=833 RepID=A0A380S9Q1_FIBSU|nr:hypothetical protein [Fibrobacter succinogenes]PWJ33585.1 hypothetical protein IE02_2760 [Fibrobacter succinogenes subsp. elongatus]SUQ25956.1 hypothetical protein SAMN05661053_2760 [Fibrobacter succinogenes]
MKRILCLLIAILATSSFALDHFWDMRYNFGPESRPSPKMGIGLGIRSPFNSDVLFPINFTTRLNKNFDVGAKLDINTYNKLEETRTALDLGVRYRYKPSSYIAFDGYLDLSETSQSALAFTIGTQQFIAKCFANYYELRAGFLDGATGKDGYAKFSASMIPTIVFGQVLRMFLEVTSSASIGNLKDDFMVDIIPKMELTFGGTHVRVDFDVGVMQEKNNDRKTIALYVMTAL